MRRSFDVLMVWSNNSFGRSTLHVARVMVELDAAAVALYSDQQAIDSLGPVGKAMIQMACVFWDLEREMLPRISVSVEFCLIQRRGSIDGVPVRIMFGSLTSVDLTGSPVKISRCSS